MRTTAYIDMKGATSPEEINRRIEAAEKATVYLGRSGRLNTRTAEKRIILLGNLRHSNDRDANFGTRAISEARRHPDGFVNLALHYGRDEAFRMHVDRITRLRRLERAQRSSRMQRRKARFDR